MNIVANLFSSSLGRKYVMAISGAALFLFVVGHLLGNLQIFLGPDQINAYGNFLQTTPEILWPARIGLLASVALHIWSAVTLAKENKAARPVPYATWDSTAASYASRTMLMSGLIIGGFVIYHLLHFTVQAKPINFTGQDFAAFHDAKGRHDVYRMMITGFSYPLVSGLYVVAMGLLCLHLSHGASAMFQSVGWKNQVYGPLIDRFAKITAWVIFVGYSSIPVAVLLGFGKEAFK
ncbi:MAG: succinate dehydrogenase cytochrome b subunit [Verrucomicrobia bacterium]|nr:MAG: succinate dehydrogenase cytochrome b subunit [Verrucomicrobiota bacterium]